MFGRSSSSETKVAAKPEPAASFPPPMPVMAATTQVPGSVIASDLSITGEKVLIVSRGRLQIDGEVRGDINGNDVVIGPSGTVTGVVTANSIDVRGHVSGALRGSTITLQPTARVDGDIVKMVLVVQEGAHFDGNVRRAKDASEVTANLGPAPGA